MCSIKSPAFLQGLSGATRKLTKNGDCDLPSACLYAPDDSSLTWLLEEPRKMFTSF